MTPEIKREAYRIRKSGLDIGNRYKSMTRYLNPEDDTGAPVGVLGGLVRRLAEKEVSPADGGRVGLTVDGAPASTKEDQDCVSMLKRRLRCDSSNKNNNKHKNSGGQQSLTARENLNCRNEWGQLEWLHLAHALLHSYTLAWLVTGEGACSVNLKHNCKLKGPKAGGDKQLEYGTVQQHDKVTALAAVEKSNV